jgi:ABC-type multidrug transport system fused ATPase/permease subunit
VEDGAPEVGPFARGVAALTTRVREVEQGLGAGVLGGARAAAQLALLAVALVALSPRLATAALLVFAPFSALLARTRRRWKTAYARAAREADALLEAADQAVRHADLWTTYGAEKMVRANVGGLGTAIAEREARLEAGAAAMSGANEILGSIALVCALWAARAGWLGHAAEGGTLLSFTVVFFLAYKPLRELAEARLALGRASAGFADLRVLAPPPDAAEASEPETDEEGTPNGHSGWPLEPLELHDVKLGRGAGRTVSMSVGKGCIVAVLGPTGAGKTTLLRTLLGLEPPVAGDICYGGKSLVGARLGPAARPFAWVPQDSPLLADTLVSNVALGATVDVRSALAGLGAEQLFGDLGSARLGAGGREVSGGEKQWIALARAIATRQPVLLLDEPTSGLDADAQQRVLLAIAGLRGKRSVVLVTHRPEPLAIADAVVRLDGEVLEHWAGRHVHFTSTHQLAVQDVASALAREA